jgi:ribosome-associated toxin RatA of RatAB toxin-antitoxin module
MLFSAKRAPVVEVFASVNARSGLSLCGMRIEAHLLVAALAVALVALAAAADDGGVSFTPAELARIKAGETVRQELPSSRKGGFYGGTGWVLIDAPPEKVWAAVVDWDQYKNAFPYTEEMTEVQRKGDRSLVRMRLGHPILTVTFHLEMRRDAERKTLSFRMVTNHAHDLDEIKGYWRLFPQPGGRTLVAYVVAFRVPMGIVNLVGSTFESTSMEGILGAPGFLKKWVETGVPNE